ncbi:MAG TPA: right-handed parallel beta-helix repeat-containing protein [Symbiobacteriaceae bacterium]|jgi:parallel beta-helix repeat protein
MAILKVPALFPTITAAVAAAAQGDVILVADGVYSEVVVVVGPEKNFIRIVAAGEDAILDGQSTLAGAFLLAGTTGVEIKGFTMQRYVGPGIMVGGGEANRIVGNQVIGNASAGISLSDTRGNLVYGNQLQNNGSSGVRLVGGSTSNWVVKNHLNTNGGDGVLILFVEPGVNNANNAIVGNVILQNGARGISTFGANTLILDNRVADTPSTSILARSHAVILGNRIDHNVEGMRVSSNVLVQDNVVNAKTPDVRSQVVWEV